MFFKCFRDCLVWVMYFCGGFRIFLWLFGLSTRPFRDFAFFGGAVANQLMKSQKGSAWVKRSLL